MVRIAVGLAALVALLLRVCSRAGGTAIYLIRLFNIIDIISNLSKLNVDFGPNIELVIKFIENLSIPEISFLAKVSPLKDSHIDDPDVNAYQLIPRGSRAKITTSNPDVFISSGQNFIISSLILLFWVTLSLIEPCFDKGNRLLTLIAFLYQFLIGLMFFDYQLICISEISFFNPIALRNRPFKFTLSLFLSVFMSFLMIKDFYHGYKMIKINAPKITAEKKN